MITAPDLPARGQQTSLRHEPLDSGFADAKCGLDELVRIAQSIPVLLNDITSEHYADGASPLGPGDRFAFFPKRHYCR